MNPRQQARDGSQLCWVERLSTSSSVRFRVFLRAQPPGAPALLHLHVESAGSHSPRCEEFHNKPPPLTCRGPGGRERGWKQRRGIGDLGTDSNRVPHSSCRCLKYCSDPTCDPLNRAFFALIYPLFFSLFFSSLFSPPPLPLICPFHFVLFQQKKSKDHFGLEGDEESTMLEDSVSPKK